MTLSFRDLVFKNRAKFQLGFLDPIFKFGYLRARHLDYLWKNPHVVVLEVKQMSYLLMIYPVRMSGYCETKRRILVIVL
jgi:hypothetical protein